MKKETPKPEDARPAKESAKDYGRASPREIMAEIEKTRERMDESLSMLGAKLHPRPGKKTFLSLAAVALSAGGFLAFRLLAGRKAARSRIPWLWRSAGILEQALLAKKLVGAARKGRPAIIVVEPRKV